METEKQVDETVYEYDEVWDRMQEAKQRKKEEKEIDAKERKVWASIALVPYAFIYCRPPAQVHPQSLELCCYAKVGPPAS